MICIDLLLHPSVHEILPFVIPAGGRTAKFQTTRLGKVNGPHIAAMASWLVQPSEPPIPADAAMIRSEELQMPYEWLMDVIQRASSMLDTASHCGADYEPGGTVMPTKKTSLPRSLKLKALHKVRGKPLTCGNPLGFTMQQQQQTQWCWAAVSVSVNLYYHPNSGQTQCAVANTAMGQTTCCQNGSTAQCNQPWFLDQALQIVGDLNAWSPGKAALAAVKGEVDACRPFCLRIGWNGGGGHFVAVNGYANQRLNIGDPWYGNSVVKYSLFPGNYQGGGTWTDNYTTKG